MSIDYLKVKKTGELKTVLFFGGHLVDGVAQLNVLTQLDLWTSESITTPN
jgi:hypothetical protein